MRVLACMKSCGAVASIKPTNLSTAESIILCVGAGVIVFQCENERNLIGGLNKLRCQDMQCRMFSADANVGGRQ